jgi:O-antigen/teichoic acid export membrane protein
MHASVGELLRHASRFGASSIIGLCISFVLLPVLTRLFRPTDYAILAGCALLVAVLRTSLSFGVAGAMEVYYYDSIDISERMTLVSTGLWFLSGWAIVIFTVSQLSAVQDVLGFCIFGTTRFGAFVGIALLITSVQIVVDYLTKVARVRLSPIRYFVLSFVGQSIAPLVGLTVVLAGDGGIFAFYRATALPLALALVLGVVMLRDELEFYVDFILLRKMIAFGLPLVPMALLGVVNPLTDRFLLLRLGSLDAVGRYSVALRFPAMVGVAATMFGLVFGPYALQLFARTPDALAPFLRQTLKLVLFVFGCGFVALGLGASALFRILIDPAFLDGYRAVWALGLAQLGTAAALVTNMVFGLNKQSRLALLVSAVCFATNVVLNCALIPVAGTVGAALATAAASWLSVVGGMYFTTRFFPEVCFDIRGMGIPIVVALSGVIGWQFDQLGPWQYLGAAAVALVPGCLLCLWLSGLSLRLLTSIAAGTLGFRH